MKNLTKHKPRWFKGNPTALSWASIKVIILKKVRRISLRLYLTRGSLYYKLIPGLTQFFLKHLFKMDSHQCFSDLIEHFTWFLLWRWEPGIDSSQLESSIGSWAGEISTLTPGSSVSGCLCCFGGSLVPGTFQLSYRCILLKRHIKKWMLPALTELLNKLWRNTEIRYGLKVLLLHLRENAWRRNSVVIDNLFLQKSLIGCLLYFYLWRRRHFFHSPDLQSEKLGAHSIPHLATKKPRNRLTKGYSLKPNAMDSVL